MNVVNIDHDDCEDVREKLKGKLFFAVSIEDGIYETHIPGCLRPSQVIYGLEIARTVMMYDGIKWIDENTKE